MKSSTIVNGKVRTFLLAIEVDILIKTARKHRRNSQRDAAMIILAYRHGLRVGELVSLRWEQVFLERAHIHIRRSKNGVDSVHPLLGDELRVLRALARQQGQGGRPQGYVFVSERGAPMQPRNFRAMLAQLSGLAGMPFTAHPHMLRHGTGYKLANDGVDTRTIQHYLGHKNIQHTTRYTELAADRFKGLWKE